MRLASVILAAPLAFATPVLAADEAISVQLNGAETVGGACRVTMVVRNDLATALSEFGLDLVVFDGSGGVADYAAVDIGALPQGKTRVRQYDVGRIDCGAISSLLVNDVRACKGEGVDPAACLSRLKVSTRTAIDLAL